MKEKKYDVALSFAGEDRKYAEELAELLQSGGYSFLLRQIRTSPTMGQGTSINICHQFTKIKRFTVSYSCLSTMHGSCGRNTNSKVPKHAHLRKIKSTFYPSVLTIRRFREFWKRSGILICAEVCIEQVYQALVEKCTGPHLSGGGNRWIY